MKATKLLHNLGQSLAQGTSETIRLRAGPGGGDRQRIAQKEITFITPMEISRRQERPRHLPSLTQKLNLNTKPTYEIRNRS